jgi:hypothetical protein
MEQARSRGLLKDAFAGQLKDRSIAGRRKLAQALLDEVPKTADNPSDEYVLLGGAIEASKDAGALALCSQAADTMAAQYDVDGLSIKTDAALKMDLRGDSPATAAENVRVALELTDSLLAAEDFPAAAKILATARRAATGDPALISAVQKRMQVVESARAAHDRLAVSLEKLKTSPNDPAANLAVGIYLCFNRGDWEQGLGLLAKGSDANFKKLAMLELSRPKTNEELIRLADRWWEIGAVQPDMIRSAIHRHAASIYKTASEGVTGLERKVLDRRIAEASADQTASGHTDAAGGAVDLLSGVDVGRDSVAGDWQLEGGVLRLKSNGPNTRRVQIPTETSGSYELTVEFMREDGTDTVGFYFPAGKGQAMLALSSWNGAMSGLHNLDGKGMENNESTVRPGSLANGQKYVAVVHVKVMDPDVDISIRLNGQPYLHWKGAQSKVAVNPNWTLPSKRAFGVAAGSSKVAFTAFRVRMISGQLRAVAEAPNAR